MSFGNRGPMPCACTCTRSDVHVPLVYYEMGEFKEDAMVNSKLAVASRFYVTNSVTDYWYS
jgi:hypothetical protein